MHSLKRLFGVKNNKSGRRTLKRSNAALPPVESMESFLRSGPTTATTSTRRSGRPPLHPGRPRGGPGLRNRIEVYPKIERRPVRSENKMMRFPAPSLRRRSASRNRNEPRIRGKSISEIRRMMNTKEFNTLYNSLSNDEMDLLVELL